MRDTRLPSEMNLHQNETEEFRVLCSNAPILALLVIPFSDIRQFENHVDMERLRLKVVNHAYDCLVSRMEEMGDYLLAPNKAFLSVVEEMDVDITTILLQIGNARSYIPFLLNLLPIKLGTGIHDDIGANYDCFLVILQLIFTPNVSQLSLKSMVKSIRAVIVYHQNHFRGTLSESLDLFVVTEKILHIMSNSLIDFYHSEGLAWEGLFQTCVLLVQFVFDPNLHESCQSIARNPLGYCQSSPPRLLHQVIIEILNSIPRVGYGPHLPAEIRPETFFLSDETKSFLLSIEVKAKDYTRTNKIDLLNAFRLLDPSLPPWP
ncbi:hypothetical protein C0992_006933 [Termitomyces sp. T32_za158]|nr:hypothetical protein C0992_006933 [Termitomyces sp. T32_za158]